MIILNERKYAEQCIENGDLGEKPNITLKIIAKYLYHIQGYKKKKIYSYLVRYMENNYPRYIKDKTSWDDTIEKIAGIAGKSPLYEDSEIRITEKEISVINDLEHSKEHKMVIFTLLCLAKLKNQRVQKNNGWVNNSSEEIFKLAHITTTPLRREEIIGDLLICGLVEQAKNIENLNLRVTFIDDEGKTLLKIDDFRELGYRYLQYLGENIIPCKNCGLLIRSSHNNLRKYCNDCSGYQPKIFKTVVCVDCGKQFRINGNNKRTKRCNMCQEKHIREYDRIRKQK